jgi:hypothetical protein
MRARYRVERYDHRNKTWFIIDQCELRESADRIARLNEGTIRICEMIPIVIWERTSDGETKRF